VSYLVGPLKQRDLLVAANQQLTREWWALRRDQFQLFSSAVAVNEAMKGNPLLATERLKLISQTTLLDINDDATALAGELLRRSSIPAKADVDALHVAVAAVHGMDYLITWNCKHIANASILRRVYAVCRAAGYEPPLICTPQELMEGEQ